MGLNFLMLASGHFILYDLCSPDAHNISSSHERWHNFISFNNISNILRDFYEKPPHNNRKCGRRQALTRTISAAAMNLLPVIHHNSINLSNISNILRYLYGKTHL